MYWNYQRVKEALDPDRRRYHFDGLPIPLIRDMEKEVWERLEIDGGPLLIDPSVRQVFVSELVERTLTNLPEGLPLRPGLSEGLTNYIWDIVRTLIGHFAVSGILRVPGCPKFFLEPLISEALLSTSVKGLTTADLPEIPTPLAIFLPPEMRAYEADDEFHTKIKLEALYLAYPSVNEETDQTGYTMIGQSNYQAFEGLPDSIDHGFSLGLIAIPRTQPRALEDYMSGDYTVLDKTQLKPRRESVKNLTPRLLLNLLLYWKSTDADVLRQLNPEWEKVNQKAHSTKGKQHQKAVKALQRIPKTEYLHLGSRLEILQRRKPEDKLTEPQEATPTGRHQPQHLRRGHWKWQPCGPQSRERKLIFVETYTAGQAPPVEKVGFSVRS